MICKGINGAKKQSIMAARHRTAKGAELLESSATAIIIIGPNGRIDSALLLKLKRRQSVFLFRHHYLLINTQSRGTESE